MAKFYLKKINKQYQSRIPNLALNYEDQIVSRKSLNQSYNNHLKRIIKFKTKIKNLNSNNLNKSQLKQGKEKLKAKVKSVLKL